MKSRATPFILLLLAMAGFLAGLSFLIDRHQSYEEEAALLRAGRENAASLTNFRAFYSTEIVGGAAAGGTPVTHEYRDVDGAIPLPATMTLEYSRYIRELGAETQLQLLSDAPFPWRDRDPLDPFLDEAISAFRSGDAVERYEYLDLSGAPAFRYAAPVYMDESCVACHNSHPESPRTDWVVGDVRGVQVVSFPVQQSLDLPAHLQRSFNDIILFVFVFVILAAGAILFSQRRIRLSFDTISRLAEEEKSRASELLESRDRIRDAAIRLDAVLSNISDGIITISEDGMIEAANPASLAIFGYEQRDFIGRSVNMLMRRREAEAHDGYLKRYLTDGGSGIVGATRELIAVRSDGSEFPIELTINRLEMRGTRLFSGVIRDISQRIRYQQQLREKEARTRLLSLVAARTDNGVIITDAEGRTEWVNEGFTRISGYTLAEMAGHRPGRILQRDDADPAVKERIRWAISGRQAFSEVLLNYSKDGAPYWVSIDAQPLFDETGRLERFIAIERDISDIKRREDELEEARRAAEAANHAKSDFLATMSHEIRTPMNGVIGMTGLLLDTPLEEQQRHYARTIRDSGESLLNIINDILDFSKMDAGQLELETTDFDLLPIVDGIIEILSPRALAKQIELASYVPVEAQRHYRGDPGRLRQILVNLVGNAVKFTDTGSVTLRMEPTDTGLRFEVQDTGIGIPTDKLDSLFQSFSQVDASTSRRYEGTGLGLAISRRLVDLMEGEIGVDSRVGEGSTFWFEIPLPFGEPPAVEPFDPDRLRHLRGLKVLVVDDNEVNRDVFLATLQTLGAEATAAPSVDEGLEQLTQGDFDIVLLDLKMPDKTGGDFVRVVRATPEIEATRILLVSSVPMREVERILDLSQVHRFLMKPIRQHTLIEAISQAMGGGSSTAAAHPTDASVDGPVASDILRLRILVAEDNAVNQQVAVGFLNKLGHHVDVAANGVEAVRAVRSLPYDVVFMDVQMPEMDGLDATRAIRRLDGPESTVRIVAMTANAMQGDEERCLAAGMDAYVSKPVVFDKLRRVIDETLGGATLPLATSSLDDDVIGTLVEEFGEEDFSALLGTFRSNITQRIEELRAALLEDDGEQITRAAHSIRGAAGTIGFSTVAETARRIEEAAKIGDLITSAKEADALDSDLIAAERGLRARYPALLD